MNIDEHPPIFQQIAQQMGIQSIPAVLAFVNGQPIDGFLGAAAGKADHRIRRADDQGSRRRRGEGCAGRGRCRPGGEGLCRRRRSLCAGAAQDANNIAALADSHAAMSAPAMSNRRRKRSNWFRRRSAAIPVLPPRAPQSSLPSRRKISDRSADLEAKVAADPKDYQARFDLALALNAKGNRDGAVDQLLEIVRRDRKWNDDGARKQLVAAVRPWGPTDEATVEGRSGCRRCCSPDA